MSEEETKREAVLRKRAENKRIADMILKGTAMSEPVQVLCIDGQVHTYHVFALSDFDIADLFERANADMADLKNPDKLAENIKFLAIGAGLATGNPDIAKTTAKMESMKLILKSFELSGLTGSPKEPLTPSLKEASTQSQ